MYCIDNTHNGGWFILDSEYQIEYKNLGLSSWRRFCSTALSLKTGTAVWLTFGKYIMKWIFCLRIIKSLFVHFTIAFCVLRWSLMESKTSCSFHKWANLIVTATDFTILRSFSEMAKTTRIRDYENLVVS